MTGLRRGDTEVPLAEIRAEDKMARREFFLTAARAVIPTLGLMGLNLSVFSRGAAAADWSSLCTGGCQGACTGCTGSCTGTCHWACSDTCKNTCSGMNQRN